MKELMIKFIDDVLLWGGVFWLVAFVLELIKFGFVSDHVNLGLGLICLIGLAIIKALLEVKNIL